MNVRSLFGGLLEFITWTILPLLRSKGFPDSMSYLNVNVLDTVLLSEPAPAPIGAAVGLGVFLLPVRKYPRCLPEYTAKMSTSFFARVLAISSASSSVLVFLTVTLKEIILFVSLSLLLLYSIVSNFMLGGSLMPRALHSSLSLK